VGEWAVILQVESIRWGDIRPLLEKRLAALREDIESPTEDHLSTQYQRGQIAGIKEAMRLAESVIQPPANVTDPYEAVSL
jgi:hypothetical protein